MAFSLSKEAPRDVRVPGKTEGLLYTNPDGQLVVRLSDGTDKLVQLPDGAPLFLESQGTDPSAQANKYRVYSKVASGAANLHVRAPDGTVIQLTGGGGLIGTGGGAFFDPVEAQIEETFTTALGGFSGEQITWNTGLHFNLPATATDWLMVPVWVELVIIGAEFSTQATNGMLFVYVFEPGLGTPQSRIYALYPGLIEGLPAQQFYTYGYPSLYGYYNEVINGDEPSINFEVEGLTPFYTPVTVHARAIMGGAMVVPDPTADN